MIKCTSIRPNGRAYIQFHCDSCGNMFGHFSDAVVRIGPDGEVRILHVRSAYPGCDAFPEAVDSMPLEVFLAVLVDAHVCDFTWAQAQARQQIRLP